MTRDAELFYLDNNSLNYAIIKNQIEFHKQAYSIINDVACYGQTPRHIFFSVSNEVDDLIEDYGGIRCDMKDLYRNVVKQKAPDNFLFGNENIHAFVPILEPTISDIKSVSAISKFNISNNKWQNPLKAREEVKYKIFHKEEANQFALEILGNVYFTNEDTDFMLDIDISSLVGFKSTNTIPTHAELYQVYRVAQDEWRDRIAERAVDEGIPISVVPKPHPFKDGQITRQEIIDSISSFRAKKN